MKKIFFLIFALTCTSFTNKTTIQAKGYESECLNQLIQVESDILGYSESSPQVKGARSKIAQFFEILDSKKKSSLSAQESVFLISKTLAEMGFKTRGFSGDDLVFFLDGMYKLEKDCDTGSWLYLAAAERYSWPLYAVLIPGHCFVRWHTDEIVFNYETNDASLDNKKYTNHQKAIKSATYFADEYNLTIEELYNSGYQLSINSSELLSKMYGPKLLELGVKNLANIDLATIYFDYAISLDPSNIEFQQIKNEALEAYKKMYLE